MEAAAEEGSPEPAATAREGGRAASGASGASSGAGDAAWDRGEGTLPDSFLRAWKASLLAPSDFFGDLRPGGSLARGLLYFLVFTMVGASLSMFWNLALGGMGEAGRLYELVGLTPEHAQLLGFFAAPFLALLFLGFFAVAYHLLVMLLVEGPADFRETVRVLCYGWSGPQVFQAIPLVGGIVAGVWSLVLVVVGIREHHATSTGRAAAVVLVPVFLSVVVPFVLVAVAVAMGALGGVLPAP